MPQNSPHVRKLEQDTEDTERNQLDTVPVFYARAAQSREVSESWDKHT